MSKEKGNKRGIIIIAAIVVAVIALVLVVLVNRGVFEKNNVIGNSIGNVRNYGYATYQKGWVYYVAPSDGKIENVGIFKSRLDGTAKKELKPEGWEKGWNVMSLNAVGDYIYFIATQKNNTTATNNSEAINQDAIDNKIYKMKIDGTDLTLINDNDFYDESYEIYVVGDKIYYIGKDINIYSMDLNGENRVALSKSMTGFLAINENYILYNDYPEVITEETTNKDYVTYIMNLDGTDSHEVNGKKLVSACIIDDYIYYTDDNKYLCKVRVDGTDDEVLVKKQVYNLNASDKYLYFYCYKNEEENDFTVCLTRVAKDGSGLNNIKELKRYSQFLDIVKDCAFYMDSADGYGYIYLYNHNKGTNYELFKVDYNNITDSSTN